jgi:ligand-binding SRPBCC domain-containing protein
MLLCIVVLNDRISEIIRLGISRGYCHRQLQSLLEKGFRSRSYRSNFDVVLF